MTYSSVVLADTPWGFWLCDEASGSTLVDSSGNTRPMTITGTPSGFQQQNGTGGIGVKGVAWPATTTDFAKTTATEAANPTAYTLEAWVYFTANPAASVNVLQMQVSTTQYAAVRLQTNGTIRMQLQSGGGTFLDSPVQTTNTWHHVVLVYNAGVAKFRIDKTNTTTISKAVALTGAVANMHGGQGAGAGAVIIGPTAFYETALSDARIDAHYNAALQTAYPAAVLADSPLAYYRLGEASKANPMLDSSGNNHTGAYVGNPTLGAAGLLPNDPDTAMSNSTGYADVAYGSWMNVNNLTLEAITQPQNGVHDMGFWDRDGADNGPPLNRTFFWRFYQGSSLEFWFWTTSGGQYNLTTPLVLNSGRTYHLAVTYDSTTAKVYIDGVFANSLTVTSPPDPLYHANTTTGLRIASLNAGFQFDPFVGVLDECAFYGTALSATRIAAHAAAAHPDPKTGTVASIYNWSGTATGKKIVKGTAAVGTYNWAGTAAGVQVRKGTTVGSYQWAGTGIGARPVIAAKQGTAVGGFTWPGTAVGQKDAPPPVVLAITRWTLTEKATGETWTMPVNPNSMTGLPMAKQLATTTNTNWQGDERMRTFQSQATAGRLDWSGVILTADHYQNLFTWSRKPGVIVVTDHLQRSFEVLIQAFTPETKAGRRPGDPKRTYKMSTLFLRRLP